MPESYYLINEKLGAQPLTAYLSRQGTMWNQELQPIVPDPSDKNGIPITPDGQLVPTVLYESSADPNTRFYLPEYQLNVVAGQHTTSLKWRSAGDDPNGPLAFLTVDVVPVPAWSGDLPLTEIPHEAVARIAYQMPVQNEESAIPSLTAFLGNWSNLDRETRGMTRLEILPLDDNRLQFHGFGKCHPADCDWGLTPAHLEHDALVGTYEFGFKQTRIVLKRRNNLMSAELTHTFAANDGRPNRVEKETLAGGNLATDTEDDRPVLWIEVGALEPVGNGVRRAHLPISDRRDFERLYQVLSDGSFNSRLVIRCFATMGRRTWRQVVLDRFDVASLQASLNWERIRPRGLPDAAAALNPLSATNPKISKLQVVNPVLAANLHVTQLNKTTLFQSPSDKVTLNKIIPTESFVNPTLDLQKTRPWAKIFEHSDLHVRVNNQDQYVLPVKAVLADDGYPQLMQIQVESGQAIAPFWFSLDRDSYVFDLPGDMDPNANHILIPFHVKNGTGQVIGLFYQDSAYTDQIYYQPQEFRVPRLDTPPYLPDMRIAFLNLVTLDGNATDTATGTATATANSQPELHYKAMLGYRAVPHIDPLLLDLAQQQMPDIKARFNALAPANTHLSLLLQKDEASVELSPVERPDVDVRFDQGLVDTIELSQSEFERIFALFQSASGIGVEGSVTAALLGDLTAHVPVLLSLKQTTGDLFSHTYLGPQGNGLHRVRLVNRIESSVTIVELYRVALGGGLFAFPQAAGNIVVLPGGQIDLDYQVTPAGANVVDIAPALKTSVNADPLKLWPQLFINQGYISDTFTLSLSIEPDYFGVIPPGGSEPLSAVAVVFGDGTSVKLSATQLQAQVTLHMPLLPRLLGSGQAKQYRYRVTNLVGEGEQLALQSEEFAGEGEAPLTIVPAGV